MYEVKYFEDASNRVTTIPVDGTGVALLGEGEQTLFYVMAKNGMPVFSIPFSRLVSCIRAGAKKNEGAKVSRLEGVRGVKR